MYLSAFILDENVTVHASSCSYVVREWRTYGTPVITNATSELGLVRQLKSAGIRVQTYRVMPCAGLPEGFWSQTPGGSNLRLLATAQGAKNATTRLKRKTLQELESTVNDMSPYLREMLGLAQQ